jgi:M6 family metalloprotease-like protein
VPARLPAPVNGDNGGPNVKNHPIRLLSALTAIALAWAIVIPTGAGAKDSTTQKGGQSPKVWGDLYPAIPADLTVSQPDGSKFKARLTNAEIGGNLEVNGFTVMKRSDGWWVYASGKDDQNQLVASGARAGLDPRPANLAPGLGRTPNVWTAATGTDIRTRMFRQLQIAAYQAQEQARLASQPVLFKFPVLMLATWWDEDAGQTSPQFQPGSDTPQHFKSILDGFGGNPRGTVTEFYFENSFGQFVVQVDVYGPFVSQRSREDRCYYGGIEPTPIDDGDLDPTDSIIGVGGGGAIGMAVEATPQADPTVDFSQYDNDGDGKVDFTGIVHSGPDMAATGDPCHTWSHAIQATLGTLDTTGIPGGIPTSDGVVLDRLFTMPEIDLQIGVAAHEMAHALGEPDYYNPSYTSEGTGDWDIMAGGSWFGNPPGSNPTGFNPASKVFQGWMTPKIVEGDAPKTTLQPRELLPAPGYTADQVNPNVILVPTVKMGDGEEDQYEHVWEGNDFYGLPQAPDGKYVVEGFYVENWSRTVNAPAIDPRMTRAPYFDRQAHASGVMVWHFDYVKRSNVYFNNNDAGTDPNRPQMDPEEWDYNDNTQELQLALTRGEPTDVMWGAATGITSATRRNPPGVPEVTGDPQETETFSGGPVIGPVSEDEPFTVEDLDGNYKMTVSVTGVGDCILDLIGPQGQSMGHVDSGFIGATESITVQDPPPGNYIARVSDFAGCGLYDGEVVFGGFLTTGAADTWSNWSEGPTGWAFTNVGPSKFDTIDHAAEAPGPEAITLDVLNFGGSETDLSPGFARPKLNSVSGRGPVTAGQPNAMEVTVFNNGGAVVPSAQVEIHEGSPGGPLVGSPLTVNNLPGYGGAVIEFEYSPQTEGFLDLFVTVDPSNSVNEVSEDNNTQKSTGWAGPANPKVLVVDDDHSVDSEVLYAGALASLGIPYAIASDHVTSDIMDDYEAVIWEAGLERYQGQLNAEDRAEIAEYLDGGGKLLYTSPRAAAALGAGVTSTSPTNTEDMPVFFANYFGADYADTKQVGGGKVTGLGDILGTTQFPMDVFPGRPQQDVFVGTADEVFGTATPVASWDQGGPDSLMAIRVDGDGDHQNFKSVFMGFNLRQLLTADDAVTVVDAMMDHFGVTGGAYTVESVDPIVYHPQVRNRIAGTDTPINVIALGSAFSGPVTLNYRAHGSGTPYTTQNMTPGTQTGTWHGVIPGADVTPNGLDYYIQAGSGSTFDPRMAADDGSVVHAIGVAIPEVSGGGAAGAGAGSAGTAGAKCPGAGKAKGSHIVGTPGKDVLRGTKGRDVICGLGGRDKLKGKKGKDLLLGGKGNDLLAGGAGNDRLKGQGGKDRLKGGRGRDRLQAGPGADICFKVTGDKVRSCRRLPL